jgi:hypothetical protein
VKKKNGKELKDVIRKLHKCGVAQNRIGTIMKGWEKRDWIDFLVFI